MEAFRGMRREQSTQVERRPRSGKSECAERGLQRHRGKLSPCATWPEAGHAVHARPEVPVLCCELGTETENNLYPLPF